MKVFLFTLAAGLMLSAAFGAERWDHIQTPQAKDDGTVPEQDDVQLVFSLAYDF